MVKKKSKSKRTSLGDKYKIQKRTTEKHRKDRKALKKLGPNGAKKKDPGIPNSWPFKEEMLREVEKAKEREATAKAAQIELNKKRQQRGTLESMMANAAANGAAYDATKPKGGSDEVANGSAGKSNRRAYLSHLQSVVSQSNVILQVLDARDPKAFRSRGVEDYIKSFPEKKMVLVLNKCDLVPSAVTKAWLKHLRRSHPTIAVSAKTGESVIRKTNDTSVMDILKNYGRQGNDKGAVVVGVIGYPNVGKSSLINSLSKANKETCSVSSRPGHTKSVATISIDKQVTVLDSPGVVFDSEEGGILLRNCVDPASMPDPVAAVAQMVLRAKPETLMRQYGIPDFNCDNEVFLGMVAKSRNLVKKKGIPDKVGAARAVLRDWNDGSIGYYTPAPADDNSHKVQGSAVVVAGFGADFDLKALDEAAFNNGMDEEDCVEMAGGEEGGDIDWSQEEEGGEEEGGRDVEMDADEYSDEEEGGMEDGEESEEERMEVEVKAKSKKPLKKYSSKQLAEADDFF